MIDFWVGYTRSTTKREDWGYLMWKRLGEVCRMVRVGAFEVRVLFERFHIFWQNLIDHF